MKTTGERRAALLPPLLVMLTGLALTACGGGGGTDGGTGNDEDAGTGTPPPPPEAGIAVGTVTGFGSIFVNGIRYDTTDAEFTVDGNAASQDDLAVGYKVVVEGTVAEDGMNGRASRVRFEAEVEAPVTSIDRADNSFTAAGQTVFVDSTTVFDDDIEPASLEGLSVGDFVEVSGYFGANDELVASHIDLEAPRAEIEVTGFVADLDLAEMRFSINQLLVDFSAARFEDIDMADLTDGLLVEVEGTQFGAEGELLATAVEGEDEDFPEGEEGFTTLSGFITAFTSPEDFEVNGQPVTTTPETEFLNASPQALGSNIRVTVSGDLDSTGVLVATRVLVKLPNNLRVEGPVESITPEANQLTVLGITIRADERTQFKDDGARSERNFNVASLATGDFVEVRGAPDPEGLATLLASRVERDDDDDDDDLTDVELRGHVETLDAPARTLTILGVTIVGDDGDDDFFSRVMVGDLVEVEGMVIADRTVMADELEFEDEEFNDGRDRDDGDENDETDEEDDDEEEEEEEEDGED